MMYEEELVVLCVSWFFVTVTKYLRKQLKERSIYFGSVSKVSVHSSSGFTFLGLWRGRTSWQRKTVHLMAVRKHRERKYVCASRLFLSLFIPSRPQPVGWFCPHAQG
jgi:hypothetical protein